MLVLKEPPEDIAEKRVDFGSAILTRKLVDVLEAGTIGFGSMRSNYLR